MSSRPAGVRTAGAASSPPAPDSAASRATRMAEAAARARRIADGGGVKMHAFEPSGRRVWTVVGDGDEHWVDPVLGYCSCPAFRFGRLRGAGGACYHLDAAVSAGSRERHDVVIFSDDEYAGLVAGLLPRLR